MRIEAKGEWHSVGYQDYRFANEAGRVLAWVRGGCREWECSIVDRSAPFGVRKIGDYLTVEQAQKAAENALAVEVSNV